MIVWMFLQGLFKGALGFLGGVVKFFAEHPAVLGMVLCTIVSAVASWNIASERTEARVTAKYEKVLAQVKAESEARAAKIASVEADSKKAAAEAAREIEDKRSLIVAISNDYMKKLEEARKNPKIKVVTVTVPGAEKPTEVFVENGVVSCRNLPSTFTETINDMVDAANGKLLTEGKTP